MWSAVLILAGTPKVLANTCPYVTDLTIIETSGLFSAEQIQLFEKELLTKGYAPKHAASDRYLQLSPKISRIARHLPGATSGFTIFGIQIKIVDPILTQNSTNQKRPAIFVDTELTENTGTSSSPLDQGISALVAKMPTCLEAAQELDFLDMTTPQNPSSLAK